MHFLRSVASPCFSLSWLTVFYFLSSLLVFLFSVWLHRTQMNFNRFQGMRTRRRNEKIIHNNFHFMLKVIFKFVTDLLPIGRLKISYFVGNTKTSKFVSFSASIAKIYFPPFPFSLLPAPAPSPPIHFLPAENDLIKNLKRLDLLRDAKLISFFFFLLRRLFLSAKPDTWN